MAKPRIFLSSTCYDLSIIRDELTRFLEERGFEVINSEKSSFGVTPGLHSHSACLEAVNEADYLLLIIGRRRGGTYIGSEKSITNEEYNRAVSLGIPCIVCVLREVFDYIKTYKKNPGADHSHIVDDVRIFHFIEYIASGHSDNWIHKFETIDDLKKILTAQFAHYLYLFSRSLRPNKKEKESKEKIYITEFPTNLNKLLEKNLSQEEETVLRNGLYKLHQIIVKILKADIKKDAKLEKLKCLWIFGRYGELIPNWSSCLLSMNMDNFKQYAWSYHRAKRVFNQFKEFGVNGWIDEDGENIYIKFDEENEDNGIAWALKDYVDTLLSQHDEENAYKLFCAADMRCYSLI